MQRVEQKRPTACGFACIAMLTFKTYDEVQLRAEGLNSLTSSGKRRGFRTTRRDLSRLAKCYSLSFGKRVKFDRQYRDVGVALVDFERCMARRRLVQPAFVAVDRKLHGKGQRPAWHWVLWDHAKGCILDPMRSYRRKPIRPWYYIPVERS